MRITDLNKTAKLLLMVSGLLCAGCFSDSPSSKDPSGKPLRRAVSGENQVAGRDEDSANQRREDRRLTPAARVPIQAPKADVRPPAMGADRHLSESKPVILNGAEFVALADAEWTGGWRTPNPVEIQLRITNRTDQDLWFLTFDKFFIRMKSSDGKDVEVTGGRTRFRRTAPVLVVAGKSYSVCRSAVIEPNPGTDSRRLLYLDGTLAAHYYAPLKSGKYTLSFKYTNLAKGFKNRPDMIQGICVWTGEAVTTEVAFTVLPK